MNQNINDSIAILTAVLLLIFAVFAITYKKGRITSHKILAAFLFANAMYTINYSLNAVEKTLQINLHWFNGLGISFSFLFGPLLYFYSKSITKKDFRIKLFQLGHFVLFIIVFLAALFKARIPFKFSILYLQTIPYMVACFILILNYRRGIKNYYSSIDKLNLLWMLYVVGGFFVMWLVDLTDYILYSFSMIGANGISYMAFFSLLINFVFAVLIFYKALQHPEIFADEIPENGKGPKYKQSHLTNEEKQRYRNILEEYFLSKKPYLNPELNINEVAQALSTSSKYISQVINETFNKNFYDFINSYRIREAQDILKDENNSKKTILEVLYDSGFNSKSAFNTAFKKHTGYTPTQYRNQINNG